MAEVISGMDSLDGMTAEALADVFIVSQAELQKSAMNVLKVDVAPAQGEKREDVDDLIFRTAPSWPVSDR